MNAERPVLAAIEDKAGAATTDADKRAVFGEILGLAGPVDERVLLGALADQVYARNLLVSRRDASFRDYLLAHPPAVAAADEARRPASNAELVRKAGRSLVDWARTGFSTVDLDVLERREEACLACPHLVTPTRLLQKTTGSKRMGAQVGKRTGDKVCDLCGCNVARKIRLTSESCPGLEPGRPAYTRWGDPAPGPA